MKRRTLVWMTLVGAAVAWLAPRAPVEAAPPDLSQGRVDFARQIRPILSDNCFACHGPDEGQRMANLRLDQKEGFFGDRGGRHIAVPNNRAQSLLWQRISHEQPIARMPPPNFERQLNKEEVELIGRWLDEGAPWQTHWAYDPPRRSTPPKVQNDSWPRNPIDYFVLARLEKEGLRPSPEADKETLIRRVTLDLTGLPPTPRQVDAFVAAESPEAYEDLVERLLQSPHYGERMAMQWLDLARYADTHGYHIDSLRDMWVWRDWVIESFNENLPFDKFVEYQVAGDLLPSPTNEQLVATGFNRNHMINYEGGAIPDEYQTEYVVDRVETISTVFLGMTMGCARCHDHKYDPIKQTDFYRFFAFFNTIPERGLDGQAGNAKPVLRLPSDDQKKRVDELTARKSALEGKLPKADVDRRVNDWRKTALQAIPKPPSQGLAAHWEFQDALADTSGHELHGKTVRGEVLFGEAPVALGVSFDGDAQIALPAPAIKHDGAFTLAFWAQPTTNDLKGMAVLQKIEDSESRRGWELLLDETTPLPPLRSESYYRFRITNTWPDSAIEVRTKKAVLDAPAGTHFTIAYDGSGKASGVQFYANGKRWELDVLRDSLKGLFENTKPIEIGNKQIGRPYAGQLDDIRIYGRILTAQEIEQLTAHEPARVVLSYPLEGCEPAVEEYEKAFASDVDMVADKSEFLSAQSAKGRFLGTCLSRGERLRDYYLRHAAAESDQKAYAELQDVKGELAKLESSIPSVMVMQEMMRPRETFVLKRGDYRNKQEKVEPGVPSVLSPLPSEAPRNRLGLAQWLTDSAHPLTARVTVNRYWQTYFGIGIVKTSEDFGSQGEMPSHAELLDWLATEFMRTGWNVKEMQRLIVTSATYRQASKVTPDLLEKDPENRLLARGPRFRLPAETVRDNALAIGGLLQDGVGGPSVYPYQPEGLWKEMALGSFFTGQEYDQSRGRDLYRRSMYTIWKRTVPPPSLATFDAPDREKCTSRRSRTNTPLQALVLMNDPTFVEASRALAQRMIQEGGRQPEKAIGYGFRLATARQPSREEVSVLKEILDEQRKEYDANPEAAGQLLAVGDSAYDKTIGDAELAAWTTVANTILNLDETITKE